MKAPGIEANCTPEDLFSSKNRAYSKYLTFPWAWNWMRQDIEEGELKAESLELRTLLKALRVTSILHPTLRMPYSDKSKAPVTWRVSF